MPAEILVVDDDPRLRELVRYTLDRAGFRVREAADGRAALDACAERMPDLVVLDVLMPELDGLAVCRQLRQTSSVPIVFLSSRGESFDRVLGLDAGGDDYLPKPFTPAELVSRVNAVLRRAQRAPAGAVVESGGVRVDKTRHRAWAGDVELSLTPTEFNLLYALVSRPGELVTRDNLVKLTYGGTHFISGRTLDSHVRGVRHKLREHGVDAIETVVGVGFRWARE